MKFQILRLFLVWSLDFKGIGLKIQRVVEIKEEVKINFLEFFFVFRVFELNEKVINGYMIFLNVNNNVVGLYFQYFICQLQSGGVEQLSLLLIIGISGRFKYFVIYDKERSI